MLDSLMPFIVFHIEWSDCIICVYGRFTFDSAAKTTAVIKPIHHDYWCESASTSSEPLHLFDKLEKVVGEQLRLLKGSEVTTSRHEGVGIDVSILNLCQCLRAVHQLSWEGCKSSRHKYPRPKKLSEMMWLSYWYKRRDCNDRTLHVLHTLHPLFSQDFASCSLCRSA